MVLHNLHNLITTLPKLSWHSRDSIQPDMERVGQEAIEAERQLVNSRMWNAVSDDYNMTKQNELHLALDGIKAPGCTSKL